MALLLLLLLPGCGKRLGHEGHRENQGRGTGKKKRQA